MTDSPPTGTALPPPPAVATASASATPAAAPGPMDALRKQLLATFQSHYETSLKLMREAFEAGKAEGKKEAAVELRRVVAEALKVPDSVPSATAAPPPPPPPPPSDSERAQRGTVRPRVIATLQMFKDGMRPADVAQATGINENSVRGMLNILAGQNVTEKRADGLWYIRDQK